MQIQINWALKNLNLFNLKKIFIPNKKTKNINLKLSKSGEVGNTKHIVKKTTKHISVNEFKILCK